MLYDPKWEVKADPLSLESLTAWLETMPAADEYDFMNCNGGCLLGQYFTAKGFRKVSVGGTFFTENGESHNLSDDFCNVAHGRPRTFGGALDRAREALVPSAN